METILKVTYPDGTFKFVNKINNKSVRLIKRIGRIFPSKECSAITAGKRMVEHVLESKGITATVSEVNIFEAFAESMRISPVIRFDEHAEKARNFGIMPWHHCMIFGDKLYCIVWDTRVIDKVISINEPIDFSEAKFVKDDSERPAIPSNPLISMSEYYEIKNAVPSKLPIEKFNLIKW